MSQGGLSPRAGPNPIIDAMAAGASGCPKEEPMKTLYGRAHIAARSRLVTSSVLLVVVVALGACGGGGGSASSSGGSGGGASAAGVDAAKKLVADHTGDVKFISPGDPIDIASMKGKQLWIISADLSIPFHQNIVRGFEEAARAAGMKPVKFDGKGQTKEFTRGIEQAVGAGAGAIALISIDTRFVSGAVKRAQAAKVPIVGVLNVDARAKPDPGTAGEATIDYTGSGELLSAFAVKNTKGGAVHALYSDTSEFRVMGYLKTGIYNGMKRYCPGCDVSSFDTQIANFKTQLPTLTQSQLKRNPDTNWLFPAFDAQSVFVVPAIKQAGASDKVRVGSINAVKANLDLIKKGDLQVVDVGNPNGWLGWAAVDRMLRAMSGAPPAVSQVPIKLFDKENLTGVDTSNEEGLFKGADFRAEYKKLWKLG